MRFLNADEFGIYIAGFVVLILVVAALLSAVRVQPGHRGVLIKWGAVVGQPLQPGLHFKIPFAETVEQISVREQNMTEKESAASNDLQDVSTQVALNYNLMPSKVDDIYQNIGGIQTVQQRILSPIIAGAVKTITAEFNADQLIAHRNLIRQKIETLIKQALVGKGIAVDAVNITNFNFSPEYNKAIERKQVAQQRALQANYELQRTKIDAKKQVVLAKAKAQAEIAMAQGRAKAIVISAKAEAKALEMKKKVITPELLELAAISKWNGVEPKTIIPNGTMPFINLNGGISKK